MSGHRRDCSDGEDGEQDALQPPLDVVQQWFQAVVTHPDGVAAGLGSAAAQSLVRLDRPALERLVRRSGRLSAEQRLSIYANAYYARLLECLGDCFPVLKQVLGAEVFDGFAFDYLQRYPSRSYTLDRLAESFPKFLEETRPEREPGPPAWPDFLIDLATLELAIAKVFDGPGAEGEPLLAAADLRSAAGFAASRLVPVPCLRLLRFSYPVNAFWSKARAKAGATAPTAGSTPTAATAGTAPIDSAAAPELPFPEPAEERVALSRTDFVVHRYTLTALELAILSALLAGSPVSEAIAAGAAASDLDDDQLAAELDAAFCRWTAAGFFRAAAVSEGPEATTATTAAQSG